MSSTRPDSRDLLPGGIFSIRRNVRRSGGLMGTAVALSMWCVGVVGDWLVAGVAGSALGFVLRIMAFPVMPLLGMPATGGTGRTLIAVGASLVVWWIVGQLVALRVAQRPVVGWKEWLRQFLILGLGLWIGALAAIAIAAVALGVM